MSGKRNKQRRREEAQHFRELDEFIGPMKSAAMEELDYNVREFMDWAQMAMHMHKLFPEVPGELLLPSQLDETRREIKDVLVEELLQHLEVHE